MNKDEAWDKQHKFSPPCGWIQWKGTDVCADITCQCGAKFHVDGWFMYYVTCPVCGQKYLMNGHIQLIPIESEE